MTWLGVMQCADASRCMAISAQGLLTKYPPTVNPLDQEPLESAQGAFTLGLGTMDANRRVTFGIQDVLPPSGCRHVRRQVRTYTDTDRVPSESSQTPQTSQTPQRRVSRLARTPTDEALKEVCKCLRLLRTLKLLPEDEPSDDELMSEDETDWEDTAMRGPPSLGLRRMLRTERKRMAKQVPPLPTAPPAAPRKKKWVDTEDTKPMWWKDMEKKVAMRKARALDAQRGAGRETVTSD